MRAKTVLERENVFLASMLDRLSAQFSGKVRKRKVIEALGRFSYVAVLYGRSALAAAAEEARAFVEGSEAAGTALVSLVAELRKEVQKGGSAVLDTRESASRKPDVRSSVAAIMKAADPRFLRFGPPRVRELSRLLRRADFRGRADSSELMSLSLKLRGDDPLMAAAFLMSLEEQGLVAIGGDPFRKRGVMVVVSGAEAVRRLRSSKIFSAKRRKRLNAVRRPLSAVEVAATAQGVRAGLRYPFGFTLFAVALVAAALSCMLLASSLFTVADGRVALEAATRAEAEKVAGEVGAFLRGTVAKARFLQSLGTTGTPPDDFFAANPEIIYVSLEGESLFFNIAKLEEWNVPAGTLDLIRSEERTALEAGKEVPVFDNISPYLGRPAALVVAPYQVEGEWKALAVAIDTGNLIAALRASGSGYSVVVDKEGYLVLHPEAAVLVAQGRPKAIPIVASILSGLGSVGPRGVFGPRTEESAYAGSFSPIDFAELYAVSLSPMDGVFRSTDRIRRINLYILAVSLVIALLFTVFYAASGRRRILQLMVASQRAQLLPPAQEQGERKSPLRGGERRIAALLCAELRGLTAIAERLEPSETVAVLNDYLAAMSDCVRKTGGIMENSANDAVSAVWGVPASTGRDASAAVDAALLMRETLDTLNGSRGTPRRPFLRVGCAIHSGAVTAARVKGEKGTQYTLIGEAAKLTSHLVSLTRRFAVDILVSEAVRVDLEATYRLAVLPRVIVSGKGRPQHVYAVLGRYDDTAAPRSIAELRERLGLKSVLST